MIRAVLRESRIREGIRGMRVKNLMAAVAAAAVVVALAGPALAQAKKTPAAPAKADAVATDRYVGYYYPKTTSSETYEARAEVAESASREARLAFLAAMARGQLQQPYAPTYSVFAKGDDADRMIIVGLGDQTFKNIYQARAQLALMTNVARTTDLFQQMAVDDLFTYFDLAKLLGFKSIVISDGMSFTHRVTLK